MDAAYFGYVINGAMGFAIGGVLMSGYYMVTSKPLGFAMEKSHPALLLPQIMLRLVAGPAILMRNVLTMQDDSLPLTLAGVIIATGWSLGSGALVLQSLGNI